MLQCSQAYEEHSLKRPRLAPRVSAPPKSQRELEMSKKTLDDMKNCVGIWNERKYHKEVYNGDLVPILDEIDLPSL